jgi:hypothetical protein
MNPISIKEASKNDINTGHFYKLLKSEGDFKMNEIDNTNQNTTISTDDEKPEYEQKIKTLEQKLKKSKSKNAENMLMQKVNTQINKRIVSGITIIGLFLALLSYIGFTTTIDNIIKHIDTDKLQEQVLSSARSEILNENKWLLDSLKTNIKLAQDSLNIKINGIADDMNRSSESFAEQLRNINAVAIGGWAYYGQQKKQRKGLEKRISELRFKVIGKSSKYHGKRELTHIYQDDTLRVIRTTNVRLGPPTEIGYKPAVGQLKTGDLIRVVAIQKRPDTRKNLEIWIQVVPVTQFKTGNSQAKK